MIGIEFTFHNGVRDWYDPVDIDSGFKETNDKYIITVGPHDYELKKRLVKTIRYYELCPQCGRELPKDGCKRCVS